MNGLSTEPCGTPLFKIWDHDYERFSSLFFQHTGLYPIVSKGMRLIAQGKDPLDGQRHMCGLGNMFHYHSTGYPELDELMRTPQPLIFIMELLQVKLGTDSATMRLVDREIDWIIRLRGPGWVRLSPAHDRHSFQSPNVPILCLTSLKVC